MSSSNWSKIEGWSIPLGASWVEDEKAYNFALFSRHATAVKLLLFAENQLSTPVFEQPLDYLKNKSGRVWHCRVSENDASNAKYYAYQIEGPRDPEQGHRFDADKILLDPYAKGVFFPPLFNRAAAQAAGSNLGEAPLGLLPASAPPAANTGKIFAPRHTSDLIIYEMHVKGFTQRSNSGVAAGKRGTFLGVIEKIPHLTDLGVTAVELLPVYQFEPEDGGNYWGYMPLNFFTPHRDYSRSTELGDVFSEFKQMVEAFHRAGIEVILDVVYNHTTEVGETGPTYSYRGIDNSSYYLLTEDLKRYRDDAGTGNVLRTSAPNVRKMIVDSLRFWVKEMNVDGFRFDLASIFTRNDQGQIELQDPPIISQIGADSDLANIRLIAEAWDLTSYQLGRSFPGIDWLQWNGKYRDDVRSFVKGDDGIVPALMTRLYGSDDLFPDNLDISYRPYQSVNFIACHDGFCLYDLVSYNQKHNENNGHQNRDGADFNFSWNCGQEGDANISAEVSTLRRKQIKNFCALLFISNGTPMFVAGDEFMNTQGGNNNPYNQDNETTWLDWDKLTANRDVYRFFKLMIAFRKSHPTFARSRFWREDVKWFGTQNLPDLSYTSHSLAFYLDGGSVGDANFYVMINAYHEDLRFEIQEKSQGDWKRVVDTDLESPLDILEPGQEIAVSDNFYNVKARSVVILVN